MDTSGAAPEVTGGAKRPRIPTGDTPSANQSTSSRAAAATIIQQVMVGKHKKNKDKSPLARGKPPSRPTAKFLSLKEGTVINGKAAHAAFEEEVKHFATSTRQSTRDC